MAATDLDLDLSKYKLGWSDDEDYVFKPKRGLNEDIVAGDVLDEGRAATGCATSACKSLAALRARPDAQLGRRHVGDRLRRHLLLHQAHRRAGRRVGRAARRDQGRPTRSSASPRPSASTSPASPPSTSPRSSTTATARTSRRQGVIFCDMDTALREYPELVQAVLRHGHPARTTTSSPRSTRRCGRGGSFIYVPPGVERRDAAAGLLPHQRREHGPVRAHADHRRRGRQGALHRGLLGAGVHHRLAALGGGRDRRQAAAPGSPTRPSRTGRTTSTTWSPSGPGSRPRATWSGSTATSAAGSR